MKKKVSRQRRWQIAQVKKGRCAICGQKRKNYRHFCDACQTKHRELKRRLARQKAAAARKAARKKRAAKG